MAKEHSSVQTPVMLHPNNLGEIMQVLSQLLPSCENMKRRRGRKKLVQPQSDQAQIPEGDSLVFDPLQKG